MEDGAESAPAPSCRVMASQALHGEGATGQGRPDHLPATDPPGWATRAHGLSQSLISGIRQKSIIKEPSPSGGSLLVSTERREYLADFFFHPANFSPLYNISFQYNPVSVAH